MPNRARAYIASIPASASIVSSIASASCARSAVSSRRMRSISSRSSMRSSARRLFCSRTSSGSTKSVDREPDCPCTTPLQALPEIGLERQHIPVVPDRDHRLLDDLLEPAVLQNAGHARQNLLARPRDLLAYLPQVRTGRVFDLGPLIDRGSDRVFDMLERLNVRCPGAQKRRETSGRRSLFPRTVGKTV